jgi:negative regulator of sigma E activity
LFCIAVLARGPHLLSSDDLLPSIVARMEQAAEQQRHNLCGYSASRLYQISMDSSENRPVMKVHLTYKRGDGKRFEVLSMQNVSVVTRRAFLSLLKEETEASMTDGDAHRLDSANYDFELLGTAVFEGEKCYRLRLKPKRKSKYLVSGEAWVDQTNFTVLKVSGELADRPSFWIRRPVVVQYFKQHGHFSFPSYNSSEAKITFVGQTRLTIDYSAYEAKSCANSSSEVRSQNWK